MERAPLPASWRSPQLMGPGCGRARRLPPAGVGEETGSEPFQRETRAVLGVVRRRGRGGGGVPIPGPGVQG